MSFLTYAETQLLTVCLIKSASFNCILVLKNQCYSSSSVDIIVTIRFRVSYALHRDLEPWREYLAQIQLSVRVYTYTGECVYICTNENDFLTTHQLFQLPPLISKLRRLNPFHYQVLVSNSLLCPPYNSYDVASKNLVLDQLTQIFFILTTCLLDIISKEQLSR